MRQIYLSRRPRRPSTAAHADIADQHILRRSSQPAARSRCGPPASPAATCGSSSPPAGKDPGDMSGGQISYDLRRLRAHQIVERIPHSRCFPLYTVDACCNLSVGRQGSRLQRLICGLRCGDVYCGDRPANPHACRQPPEHESNCCAVVTSAPTNAVPELPTPNPLDILLKRLAAPDPILPICAIVIPIRTFVSQSDICSRLVLGRFVFGVTVGSPPIARVPDSVDSIVVRLRGIPNKKPISPPVATAAEPKTADMPRIRSRSSRETENA